MIIYFRVRPLCLISLFLDVWNFFIFARPLCGVGSRSCTISTAAMKVHLQYFAVYHADNVIACSASKLGTHAQILRILSPGMNSITID